MPSAMASRGEAIGERAAVEPHLAGLERVDAEDRPRQLGAPGADQPGEAEDLAAAEREVDRAGRGRWRCGRPATSSTGSPGGAAGGR